MNKLILALVVVTTLTSCNTPPEEVDETTQAVEVFQTAPYPTAPTCPPIIFRCGAFSLERDNGLVLSAIQCINDAGNAMTDGCGHMCTICTNPWANIGCIPDLSYGMICVRNCSSCR